MVDPATSESPGANPDRQEDLLEQLDELLQHQRDGLRAGHLDEVIRLTAETEALVDHLAAVGPPPGSRQRLRQLQRAALRNGVLLRAAVNGVRAASDRLKALTLGPDLSTYDGAGRRTTLTVGRQSVTRKA